MEILDIGCGIGGPARTLAADFGCRVFGLDITEEYIRAAQVLTDMLHLSSKVSFQTGDALNLKFENKTFDVVWHQSAFMNIEHKFKLLSEIYRVLRSNCIFVFEAQMKGSKEEFRFPVLWADSPEVSFMMTSQDFRQLVEDVGFIEKIWKDITGKHIVKPQALKTSSHEASHPFLNIFNLVQSDLPRKRINTIEGLKDGTYTHVYAVYEKAA